MTNQTEQVDLNPGLKRFGNRLGAAEVGKLKYVSELLAKEKKRQKKRTNRCRNPFTHPRKDYDKLTKQIMEKASHDKA